MNLLRESTKRYQDRQQLQEVSGIPMKPIGTPVVFHQAESCTVQRYLALW